MTILITGAAGRTSGYVIRALQRSPQPPALRLLVRSEGSAKKVQETYGVGPSSVAITDYLERKSLHAALQGVDVVFHNGPSFNSQEAAMGIAVIDAAREAGVKHFVYCSVLFSLLTKLLNHKPKLAVEEYLIESGLNYTIIQPTSFMQNFDIRDAVSNGKLIYSFNSKIFQGFLDLEDNAAIASLILLDPTPHNRARYELVGENTTLEDVAKLLEDISGKSITCEPLAREQLIASIAKKGGPEAENFAEGLDRMLYYYDKRGIPGNPNTVRWLLGREPTSWRAVIERALKE
ncbi:NAD-P-binding protein [Irpex rosettiformis]|uniref:NAD-P-binding protein n=1 Tax=Irpex rosettiformis TaxID=378272 RepID=A0ACB8U623_9APHY|nr:NAD-P-binding protein [Irpex rosettiformis]